MVIKMALNGLKLCAYGHTLIAFKFILDHLINGKQRTIINCFYNKELEVDFGMPKGFILGPHLYNIFSAGPCISEHCRQQ